MSDGNGPSQKAGICDGLLLLRFIASYSTIIAEGEEEGAGKKTGI